MKKENKKIGFFTRIKIAVTKLEDYGMFLEEKTSVAVKYFFLIVLILTMIIAIVQTFHIMKMVKKGYAYIQNEIPDFSYEKDRLQFSQNVNAYDQEFDFYMIADTTENITPKKIKKYKENIKSNGIIFLKDKAIYQTGAQEVEYPYQDFANQYGVQTFDKNGLIEQIENIGLVGIAVTLCFIFVISFYMVQVISVFMDWLIITIFAYISARICRIYMNFKQAFHISIYALTLSLILSMAYQIANYLTGFYTEYFRLVYLLISYVYVVAAILMMKSDLLKQQAEVGRIVDVQKKNQEQTKDSDETQEEKKENKKPEPKDKNKQKNPEENPMDGEPDGSEI